MFFARRPIGPHAIIDFDSRVQVAQEFTNDADALEDAIRRTRAGGSTALDNALYIASNNSTRTRW